MTDEFVEKFVSHFRTYADKLKEIGPCESFSVRYKDSFLTLTIEKRRVFFYKFNNDFHPSGDIYVEKVENNFLITVQRCKHFDYFINDNVISEEEEMMNLKRWMVLGDIIKNNIVKI